MSMVKSELAVVVSLGDNFLGNLGVLDDIVEAIFLSDDSDFFLSISFGA